MKTIVNRAIVFAIICSFLFAGALLAIFFFSFPVTSWRDVWETKIFELPFVVFVPAVTVLFGAVVGLAVGIPWRKQLILIENELDVLQHKSTKEWSDSNVSSAEMQLIAKRLTDMRQYIHDQTKRTQKLIDERLENQEQQMEKVISDERNRLARELHDSVSQELFAASMMVSAVNEVNTGKDEILTKQLGQVESIIQQAQLEMRALLLHLRPVALKDNTLQEGMKQLLAELQQKVPIEVTWKMEQVNVSRGVEDHLFRILQESVSNTLRHAKAHSLDILLMERDNFVILRVVDDGVGFDVEKNKAGSYGLTNMKERAAEIGAHFRIISVPNEGTRLEVRVPIINAEGDERD